MKCVKCEYELIVSPETMASSAVVYPCHKCMVNEFARGVKAGVNEWSEQVSAKVMDGAYAKSIITRLLDHIEDLESFEITASGETVMSLAFSYQFEGRDSIISLAEEFIKE